MNRYLFEFRSYCRPFKQPLHTHHGWWHDRRGILLRLTDSQGRIGWGEIAPIEWFGTEEIEQALAFCRSLPSTISADMIGQIPATLPACQFGFEAAIEVAAQAFIPDGPSTPEETANLTNSYLLPTGAAALQAWNFLAEQGAKTFKWKIGVADLKDELQIFEQLIHVLPADAYLRLDANSGLEYHQASQWLQCCDRVFSQAATVEFLEQPLPADQLKEMLQLAERFRTPIALDESVATFEQLQACYRQGWRGVFVIKAALIGSPKRLRDFCQQHTLDLVWSSVFETPIGQQYIQQRLIPSIPVARPRAIGFGVNQWFNDAWVTQDDFEQLWQSL